MFRYRKGLVSFGELNDGFLEEGRVMLVSMGKGWGGMHVVAEVVATSDDMVLLRFDGRGGERDRIAMVRKVDIADRQWALPALGTPRKCLVKNVVKWYVNEKWARKAMAKMSLDKANGGLG